MPLPRRRFLVAGLAALGLLLVGPVLAQTLDQAKADGLVGEMPNGYVDAVQPSPGLQTLIDAVNAERRARYQEIAAANGVPLAAVEEQAGRQLIERAAPGHFVRTPSGQWVRK